MLTTYYFALWDVLASCSITGAKDASIRNPVPNDFTSLLRESSVERVFATGQKAFILYMRYCFPYTNIPAICLPSPSPANCGRWSLEKLVEAYTILNA